MRNFLEPTCRNLLRRPLVLGVPFAGLLAVAFVVIAVQAIFGGSQFGNVAAVAVGVIGYLGLRIFSRFASCGWDETLIYWLERVLERKKESGSYETESSSIQPLSSDTLDQSELLSVKQGIEDRLRALKRGQRFAVVCTYGQEGALFEEVRITKEHRSAEGESVLERFLPTKAFVYSLIQLPMATDPLWFSSLLARSGSKFRVLVSARGLDVHSIKEQIEGSRRRNAHLSGVASVEDGVAFDEASRVLQGLSRGDEAIVELSVVIVSEERLDLDPRMFLLEKKAALPLLSVLGLRSRFHRAHICRTVTAADLVPNFLDPNDGRAAILKTRRGNDLCFDPQDPKLEALHWLVVGASGSGKSFLTGLVLARMLKAKVPMSVLFIDHNRSFRRIVQKLGFGYLEPECLSDLSSSVSNVFGALDRPGAMAGVELSDMSADEKKLAAHFLLSRVEDFLRKRESLHPVYVVLDECWNFLKDEPVLVQRFFREFRKLNGAAIAITQSLSDFLMDESGRSIFQNAPVRILLRQGEDLGPYRGALGLNEVELSLLRLLRQEKGCFSECLIKTPYLSRLGRLHSTEEEYELLRTDNIRAELIRSRKESAYATV